MLILLAAPALAAPTCKVTTTLTAQEGTFTDGSKAEDTYANDQSLCWHITPACPDEGRVKLWFERMNLETEYDFVQIYDADGELLDESADGKSTYSGTGFTVWFSSDYSIAGLGFSAAYSCETLSEDVESEELLELYRVKNTEKTTTSEEDLIGRRGG
jgi:hypothetical protein